MSAMENLNSIQNLVDSEAPQIKKRGRPKKYKTEEEVKNAVADRLKRYHQNHVEERTKYVKMKRFEEYYHKHLQGMYKYPRYSFEEVRERLQEYYNFFGQEQVK